MHDRNKLYIIDGNITKAGMMIKQVNTYKEALTDQEIQLLTEACAKLGEVSKSILARLT